jgi:hypothetical protein
MRAPVRQPEGRHNEKAFGASACGGAGHPDGRRSGPALCLWRSRPAGGAQLICSHIDPTAPPQSCSFFWSLMSTDDTTSVVQGTFLLEPGTSNAIVYQGFGFNMALANPIIICQGAPS